MDNPSCRVCGCTADHACEGGCFWVEDPEGLGDLCSQCLPKIPSLIAVHNHVHEISLDQIRPAPWNPPSRLDPERVKDLAESIRIEGQQSPALLRPVEAAAPVRYELVWGHRRYAALKLLVAQAFQPVLLKCFIREMTEEDAMISSGIENLQREGFSDIEEAEFFRTCSERYGDSAVKVLAEKLSVSDRYIRKRLEVLKLPETALALWRTHTWHIGHLEQLLRLGENAAAFLAKFDDRRLPELRVYELKDLVDRQALPLHAGHFDKTDCKVCRKNTDVQRRLFGGDKDKTKCLDQDCFQTKEQAWLDINWPECKDNKWGTRTAVIGDYHTKNTGVFSDTWKPKPVEKCRSCPQFTTILSLSRHGRGLSTYHDMACLGDPKCFAAAGRAGNKDKNPEPGASNPKPGTQNPEPRVTWHGEHFRQKFYRQEIPQLMANLPADDPRRLHVALALLVHSCRDLHEWFWQQLGLEVPTFKNSWERFHPSIHQILQQVKGRNSLQAELLLAEVLVKIALQLGRGYETTISDRDRQALAEFLDLDWSRFRVTEYYLEKKTKAEIVAFIARDSGLAAEPAFLEYLQGQGFPSIEKLAQAKKPALVDLLLNCGVDLHGRLPREIADKPDLSKKEP